MQALEKYGHSRLLFAIKFFISIENSMEGQVTNIEVTKSIDICNTTFFTATLLFNGITFESTESTKEAAMEKVLQFEKEFDLIHKGTGTQPKQISLKTSPIAMISRFANNNSLSVEYTLDLQSNRNTGFQYHLKVGDITFASHLHSKKSEAKAEVAMVLFY
jgi:hypothetical protein